MPNEHSISAEKYAEHLGNNAIIKLFEDAHARVAKSQLEKGDLVAELFKGMLFRAMHAEDQETVAVILQENPSYIFTEFSRSDFQLANRSFPVLSVSNAGYQEKLEAMKIQLETYVMPGAVPMKVQQHEGRTVQ